MSSASIKNEPVKVVDPDVGFEGFHRSYEFSTIELAESPFKADFLDQLENEGRVSHTERLRLTLAIQEALANSMEHGNLELESVWREEFDDDGIDRYSLTKVDRLSDPTYAERKIGIEVSCFSQELVITISDQGKGFSIPEKVGISKSSAMRCYGRGLTIIEQVMDETEYFDQGRVLKMRCSLKLENGNQS